MRPVGPWELIIVAFNGAVFGLAVLGMVGAAMPSAPAVALRAEPVPVSSADAASIRIAKEAQ